MLMQGLTGDILCTTVIQHAHPVFGRRKVTSLNSSGTALDARGTHRTNIVTFSSSPARLLGEVNTFLLVLLVICAVVNFEETINKDHLFTPILYWERRSSAVLLVSWSPTSFCSPSVRVAVSTVCALYEGTLVTSWTTAPCPCRSSSALLAYFCLIVATLTITARCYTPSGVKHPLDQLNPQRSPIQDNSSTQAQHTSNVALSRLFNGPREAVQSDTSLIFKNSKILLYNQTNAHKRKKRQFHKNPYFLNSYSEDDTNEIPKFLPTSERNAKFSKLLKTGKSALVLNLEKRSDAIIVGTNESESALNVSDSRVTTEENLHETKNGDQDSEEDSNQHPMQPPNGEGNSSLVSEWGVLVLVLSAVVLTVALGLVTCVLNHYRSGAGGTAAVDPHDAAQTPTTAPMLSVVSAGAAAGVGGMDRLRGRGAAARELAATRDRQVRLHTVHTDIAINLPPSIAMPDGEEHTFTSSRLHIRDSEQESEIYQKCIRPPPNRTVLESESPPPYRSSSAGLLGSTSSSSSSSGSNDWSGGNAPLVVRCHSMSSTSKRPEAGPSGPKTDFIQRTVKIFTGKNKSQPPPAPTLPVVIVPSRPRRTSDHQQGGQSQQNRPTKPSV